MSNELNTLNSQFPDRYRKHIAALDLSVNEVDALINIVYAILSHFVDQAFYVQTDQITVDAAARTSNMLCDHDSIGRFLDDRTAVVIADGVEGNPNPEGSSEP